MNTYDYKEAIKNDICDNLCNFIDCDGIREAINESDKDSLAQAMNEAFFCTDCVTGNASGSYTFSSFEAEENLCHNLDLLHDACNEYEADLGEMIDSPETADVTIRCYLLSECIEECIEENFDEWFDEYHTETEED